MGKNMIGRDNAWEHALVEQNRGWLIPYMMTLAGDFHTAEDLVQNVFYQALKYRDRYDGSRPLGAWLRGIARNVARQHWRAQGRDMVAVNSETVEILETTLNEREKRYADPEYSKNRMKALSECMAGLAPRVKSIIMFKYFEKMRAKMIGQRLHMAESAVLVALSRARKVLFNCVNEKLTEM